MSVPIVSRRRLLLVGGAAAAVVAALAIYHFALSGSGSGTGRSSSRPTSVIGSGSKAVGVTANGVILTRRPPPAHGGLPSLPIDKPPAGRRLKGTLLEQARVLGAAPAVLRSCVEGSHYGENGVDVKLASGIELRFGSATAATRKWAAAVAILADPTITEIGYVDLHSPGHAATGGSGTNLPQAAPGGPTSCAPH